MIIFGVYGSVFLLLLLIIILFALNQLYNDNYIMATKTMPCNVALQRATHFLFHPSEQTRPYLPLPPVDPKDFGRAIV